MDVQRTHPNGNEINLNEERCTKTQSKEGGESNGALLRNTNRNCMKSVSALAMLGGQEPAMTGILKGHTCGVILENNLENDKSGQEQREEDEQSDNTTIRPCIGCTAPLQSKQQADDGWKENNGPKRIQSFDDSPVALLLRFGRFLWQFQ